MILKFFNFHVFKEYNRQPISSCYMVIWHFAKANDHLLTLGTFRPLFYNQFCFFEHQIILNYIFCPFLPSMALATKIQYFRFFLSRSFFILLLFVQILHFNFSSHLNVYHRVMVSLVKLLNTAFRGAKVVSVKHDMRNLLLQTRGIATLVTTDVTTERKPVSRICVMLKKHNFSQRSLVLTLLLNRENPAKILKLFRLLICMRLMVSCLEN